jgi:hypothetical protein
MSNEFAMQSGNKTIINLYIEEKMKLRRDI